MAKRICSIIIPVLVLLGLVGCGAPAPKQKVVAALADSIALEMPSGWTDDIIEKVKNNQPLKKVIAVMDFEGNDKLKGYVDLKMSDMLTTALVKTGKFDLVERNKIDRVFKEQGLKASGAVDAASNAAEMGKLLGAEFVVFGTISGATESTIDKFSYKIVRVEISVDIRAVNTTDGKILLSEKATGIGDTKIVSTADGTMVSGKLNFNSLYSDGARDAVDKCGKKIGQLFPLLGFLVNTNPGTATIDIGEERGVQKDDYFIIFRIGNEVKHPATGKHLGWQKDIISAMRIISTEQSMATGKILNKSSPSAQPGVGDMVIQVK
jgi:curli biogenesis system outer membrane secretion channel CsgG